MIVAAPIVPQAPMMIERDVTIGLHEIDNVAQLIGKETLIVSGTNTRQPGTKLGDFGWQYTAAPPAELHTRTAHRYRFAARIRVNQEQLASLQPQMAMWLAGCTRASARMPLKYLNIGARHDRCGRGR